MICKKRAQPEETKDYILTNKVQQHQQFHVEAKA